MLTFKEYLVEAVDKSDIKQMVDNPYSVNANTAELSVSSAIFYFETVSERDKGIKQLVKKGISKKDIFKSQGHKGEMYRFQAGVKLK